MHAARTYRRPAGRGADRFILGTALLVPLVVVLLVLTQLPVAGSASPSVSSAEPSTSIAARRPVSSNLAPPPTLEPPAATPAPTAGPPGLAVSVPAPPTGTYVVQPGDELKGIAADHHVSIWKLIAANDIPNPDSLTIGQELSIPSE